MLRRSLVAVFAVAFSNAAWAQTTIVLKPNIPSLPPLNAAEQIRVSLGVTMFVPAAQSNPEQELKAQEDSRRLIYDLAARECSILLETLASDCRLDGVNLNVQRLMPNQNFGQPRTDGFNLNGNITFRIMQKQPEAPAKP